MIAPAIQINTDTFPGPNGSRILPFPVSPPPVFPSYPYPTMSPVPPLCSAHNCTNHATMRLNPTARCGESLPFCDEHLPIYIRALGGGYVRAWIENTGLHPTVLSTVFHPALGLD